MRSFGISGSSGTDVTGSPTNRSGEAAPSPGLGGLGLGGLGLGDWAMHILVFMGLNWVLLFSNLAGMFMPGLGAVGHQGGYVVALALALYGVATAGRLSPAPLPPVTIIIALLWCWVSVSWAIDADTAVRKLMLTSCVIVTAFAVVPQIGYERAVAILRQQMLVALVLSYLLVLLWPTMGIQSRLGTFDEVGGWRGIMVDKNSCGAFCAAMALLFLFDAGKLKPLLRWGAFLAAIVFLIGTRSKTAMGILVAIIPIGFLVLRYNPAFRLLLVPVAVCGAIFVFLAWNRLLLPFERALYDPEAFTGRGMIWKTLVGYIRDHWLLGAGYGSFWGIGPRSPVFVYTDLTWVQALFVGHNGYLDVWSQVGLPGLLLVLLAVFVVPFLRMFKSRTLAPSRRALLCALMLFILGDNVTESTLFDRDTLLNIFAMIVIALIGAGERDGRPAITMRGRSLRSGTVRAPHALRGNLQANRAAIMSGIDATPDQAKSGENR